MTLTEAEIAALVPILRAIAGRLGRRFPAWLMSNADLVQTAFLGILKVLPRAEETAEDLRCRRLKAGQNRMIDGIRAFHDTRPGNLRRMEVIIGNFDHLVRTILVDEDFEDRTIEAIDRKRLVVPLTHRVKHLTLREQTILRERLRGKTLLQVATSFHRTEGWACQQEKKITTKLHDQYREAA